MADAARDIPRMSAAEYLQMERQATCRHEFFNGIVYAIAGASKRHDSIAGDVFGYLLGKVAPPCQVFSSDVKVRIRAMNDECHYYPDTSVTCSDLDNDAYDVTQPSLIIEVLSRTTEDADRGYKFDHYRLLSSLQEYVLVHQERACAEVYRRRADWEKEIHVADDEITFVSVGVTMPVAQLYRRVRFGEAAT